MSNTDVKVYMDSDNNNSEYSEALNIYGESPKSLLWNNYKSVALRYRQLLTDLNIDNKSVLDVGCGMGDFIPYLFSKSKSFYYLGVDINAGFIDIAKKHYEGMDFRVLNPFEEELSTKFDIVVLCGALNANEDNWLETRKQKITKLFDMAGEALVFNMAGGMNEIPTGNRIAYANAQEIIDFCSTLTPKILFQGHYHPKDFTLTLFK